MKKTAFSTLQMVATSVLSRPGKVCSRSAMGCLSLQELVQNQNIARKRRHFRIVSKGWLSKSTRTFMPLDRHLSVWCVRRRMLSGLHVPRYSGSRNLAGHQAV